MKYTATATVAFVFLAAALAKFFGASDVVCFAIMLVALYLAIQFLEHRISKLEMNNTYQKTLALEKGIEDLKDASTACGDWRMCLGSRWGGGAEF